MRHLQTKTTGKFSRSIAIMLAVLITVSMAAVAFTATQAPVVSAVGNDPNIVEVGTLANSNDAYWVDATYFDYLSDVERSGSWLSPIQAGTGFPLNSSDSSQDNWYPFNDFNSYISKNLNAGTYPLYFGNFCFTPGAYNTSQHSNNTGTYIQKVKDLKNFSYIANNSNAIKVWSDSTRTYDNTYAVQGLAQSKLDSKGNILATGGGVMPYFNESDLTSKNYAKVIKSYFPFNETITGTGNDEVRTYRFSSDGTDNVFFNWNGNTPKTVNYGNGTTYAVQDGLKYFMGNTNSSYGIFPFNNANSTTAGSRSGNSNLDYGFGIKMEFDFKVPEGATYANDKQAEFKYSGDDDLWVYMAEYKDDTTLGDSHLVLDLGGNHSQTEGSINFKTMKSTAKKTVTINKGNYDSNYIYIHDDYGWGFWDDGHQVNKTSVEHNTGGVSRRDVPCLQIKAWGDGKSDQYYVPEWDDTLKMFKISLDKRGSGKPYASGVEESWAPRLRDMSGFLVTSVSGSAENDPNRQTKTMGINDYKGKVVYTSVPDYNFEFNNAPIYETPSYSTNTITDLASLKTSDNKQLFSTASDGSLDSSKKYHMTIFYMERGMIESNNHMEFMLTPADNELKIEKEVKVDNVNSALKSDVKKKDKFNFTAKRIGTPEKEASTSLGDGEYTYYNSYFKTGSEMTVTETINSNLTYTTSYEVRDMLNLDWDTGLGESIVDSDSNPESDSDMKAEFTLWNYEAENDYDDAHIHVNFTNTPVVESLTISKKITKDTQGGYTGGIVQANDTFEFTMSVDLAGGTDYKAYQLDYKDSSSTADKTMTADGKFSFNSANTVTVAGLPVGASYKIEETDKTGYTPVQKTITGVVGTSDNKAAFENRKLTKETNATISAKKTLDGQAYKGGLFSFTLSGLPSIYGSKDTSTYSKVVDTVKDGKIDFGSIEYTEPGTYRYKIVENAVTDDKFASDITTDSKIYLVNVVVTENNSQLIAAVTYKETTKTSGYTAADFEEGSATAPTFANSIKKGSVTVKKFNQSNTKLDDTEFTLYKVNSNNDNNLTTKVKALTTGKDGQEAGQVKFESLDIYKSDYTPAKGSTPQYQWYCIVESDSATGYSKNETKMYFQLPKEGVYDITFTYQNGKIFSPTTSGVGMQIFRTIGIAVSVFALLLLAAYIYRTKRYTVKYAK